MYVGDTIPIMQCKLQQDIACIMPLFSGLMRENPFKKPKYVTE